ncbi:GNAT family N-acetyltransferase [Alkalicoccobacillus gibsonii]|uniref:GNAT family N-acetyltransferase n=2 Tax=Alkalicoccobacillus gibsonii TaxID=79881 RepID=UPI0023EB0636|nr:GNAT family N-acetyltransferase [Alkalicoccobacillus gibsonii]
MNLLTDIRMGQIMSHNPSYRLATLEDAEEILDLTLRAYAPIRELGIHFAAATADLELVKENIMNNACYVMLRDHKILATASLRMPWGLQPGPFGVPHLWWFATDPTHAQKGDGSDFLHWIEHSVVAEQLKAPYLSLGTADKHPWLIGMYERRGYERAGSADLGKGHITIYLKKTILPHLIK